MATRRLNFLKRVRIEQKDVTVRLQVNGVVKRFKVELDLAGYGFPPEARIYVEAKQLMETLRFPLGTVGEQAPPVLHDCSRLHGERISFNVLVVDSGSARILGSVNAVRPVADGPDESGGAIPLLPVDGSARLAPLVWEIEYADTDQEGHSDAPILRVDAEAAQNSGAFFMQDVAVRALVLPAAMREILTRIVLVDRSEYDRDSRSWRNCWIRFATRLVGEAPPSPTDPLEPSAVEDVNSWIGRASRALAQKAELLPAYLKGRGE